MKVFISADIEGVTGAAHWDEANRTNKDYTWFAEQMTRETAAACRGALAAGADEVLVKDAHGSGRNLILDKLPEGVRVVRDWARHPCSMMQGLDDEFRCSLMVGYHSRVGSNTHPLAHTKTGALAGIWINGREASEFYLNTLASSQCKVPVVFLSGDKGIVNEASETISGLLTVATTEGVGDSVIARHPQSICREIEEKAQQAVSKAAEIRPLTLPKHFELIVSFKEHAKAYRASFYPGVSQTGPNEVTYEAGDYMDIMKAMMFTI